MPRIKGLRHQHEPQVITDFANMKALFLVIALVANAVHAQVISPCVTQCLISYCPNGVSDHPCFCVSEAAIIEQCFQSLCDTASLGTGQALMQSICNTYMLYERI
jgi:hypothetical protein